MCVFFSPDDVSTQAMSSHHVNAASALSKSERFNQANYKARTPQPSPRAQATRPNSSHTLAAQLTSLDAQAEKPGKIRNFQKNGKMIIIIIIIRIIIIIIIIIIINFHNGSGKPRKFSRSRMTKRIAPLNPSRKI